jgi:hypothetical protein
VGANDERTAVVSRSRPLNHPKGDCASITVGLRDRRLGQKASEEARMTEYIVRFFVGGIIVSAFAISGDILRPKSFAGLFGAAPSVALATLAIAVYTHGAAYAVIQSRSMMIGAIALAIYSVVVCQLLIRARMRAVPATLLSLLSWLAVAFGLLALTGVNA